MKATWSQRGSIYCPISSVTRPTQTFVDHISQDVFTAWRLFSIKNSGHLKEDRRLMWTCYSRGGGIMTIAGVPSLFPAKKSVFSRRGLAPITDVAEPRRLAQTAAPRRRRVRCAQTCLDADRGVSVAHVLRSCDRSPVLKWTGCLS